MSIYLSVCLCWQSLNIAPKPIDRYRWNSVFGVVCKYPGSFIFNFPPIRKINSRSCKKKNYDFLKNGINNFDEILWVYSTFETHQYDTIGFFPEKIHETRKLFLNLLSVR